MTPASRRQDHTTSPSAPAPFVKSAPASTASRTALMTLRNTPLWGRTAGVLEVICPTREVKYFRCGDWTGKFAKAVLICPSGWIASLSRTEPIAPAHANRQNRTAGISEITPRNRTCCGHAKTERMTRAEIRNLLLVEITERSNTRAAPNFRAYVGECTTSCPRRLVAFGQHFLKKMMTCSFRHCAFIF